jgi:hypothetical protein
VNDKRFCSILNERQQVQREQEREQQQQQQQLAGDRYQQPVGALTYSQLELFRQVEEQCAIRRSGLESQQKKVRQDIEQHNRRVNGKSKD